MAVVVRVPERTGAIDIRPASKEDVFLPVPLDDGGGLGRRRCRRKQTTMTTASMSITVQITAAMSAKFMSEIDNRGSVPLSVPAVAPVAPAVVCVPAGGLVGDVVGLVSLSGETEGSNTDVVDAVDVSSDTVDVVTGGCGGCTSENDNVINWINITHMARLRS